MLDNSVDLRYTKLLLGYLLPQTTEIYTHITTKPFESIEAPIDDLSQIFEIHVSHFIFSQQIIEI